MIRRPAAVGVSEDDNVRVDKIWVQVGKNSLSLLERLLVPGPLKDIRASLRNIGLVLTVFFSQEELEYYCLKEHLKKRIPPDVREEYRKWTSIRKLTQCSKSNPLGKFISKIRK